MTEIEESTFVIFVLLKRCVRRVASFWLALVITSTGSVSGLDVRSLAIEKNRPVKRDIIDDGTGITAGHGIDQRVIEKQHHFRARRLLESAAPSAVSVFGDSFNDKDVYTESYEQFVKCMKLGIHENSVDDSEIAELL